MGVGSNHNWRKQWRKQASRGSEHKSRRGRTRSRSILQRYRFWTSVISPLGGQRRGCPGGGGNRTVYIWRGQRTEELEAEETIGEEEGMPPETTTGWE